eukprot:88461_1
MFTKAKSNSLLNNDEEDSQYHEMAPVAGSIQQTDDHTAISKDSSSRCVFCSWKCACLTTWIIVLLLIGTLIVMIATVGPQFAQDTLDNAAMDIINGSIVDPTNGSITLHTNVLLSNAGMVDGTLGAHTATVTVDGIEIGTMPMPVIHTVANQNVIVSLSAVLNITNKTQFQKTCGELLQNIDQTWHLSGRGVTLTVDAVNKDFTVNVEKDLVLKAAHLFNFIASDMNVNSATTKTVRSVSNLKFISQSIFEFHLPNTLMYVYYDDVYIGYSPLDGLAMIPGLNTIEHQDIIIEKTSDNEGKLDEFFSNYLHGIDQEVFMKGPIPDTAKGYSSLVIDGIFQQTVTSLGYTGGDLAFGGLLTSATQQGWKVDGKTIHGAYSNFLNPLNVPVRITYVHGVVTMPQTLKYHVNLIKWAVERDCEATVFAQLHTGRGMFKANHDITWVDVEENARATYFAMVEPPEGQFKGNCMGLPQYQFDCCFATLSTAYACYMNPAIHMNPSSGELTSDYLPLSLEANVTILVDKAFKIVTKTSQPFLPLYFGKEVYAGYAGDFELNCKQFTFK